MASTSLTIRWSPLTRPNARAAELARTTRSSASTTTPEERRTLSTEATPGGSTLCGADGGSDRCAHSLTRTDNPVARPIASPASPVRPATISTST
jgi:hypothetical protein